MHTVVLITNHTMSSFLYAVVTEVILVAQLVKKSFSDHIIQRLRQIQIEIGFNSTKNPVVSRVAKARERAQCQPHVNRQGADALYEERGHIIGYLPSLDLLF
jgi:hypothetical protein